MKGRHRSFVLVYSLLVVTNDSFQGKILDHRVTHLHSTSVGFLHIHENVAYVIVILRVHGRRAIRSGAGTPQVPCQEWCRNGPTEFLTQRFQGYVIRRLSACTHKANRVGNSNGGLPCLTSGSETDKGIVKDKKGTSLISYMSGSKTDEVIAKYKVSLKLRMEPPPPVRGPPGYLL